MSGQELETTGGATAGGAILATVRTGVQAGVGVVAGYAATHGAVVDVSDQAAVVGAVMVLCTVAYTVVVGLLERKVHPLFGVLFGVPRAPRY
jgi:hypothetical protein